MQRSSPIECVCGWQSPAHLNLSVIANKPISPSAIVNIFVTCPVCGEDVKMQDVNLEGIPIQLAPPMDEEARQQQERLHVERMLEDVEEDDTIIPAHKTMKPWAEPEMAQYHDRNCKVRYDGCVDYACWYSGVDQQPTCNHCLSIRMKKEKLSEKLIELIPFSPFKDNPEKDHEAATSYLETVILDDVSFNYHNTRELVERILNDECTDPRDADTLFRYLVVDEDVGLTTARRASEAARYIITRSYEDDDLDEV